MKTNPPESDAATEFVDAMMDEEAGDLFDELRVRRERVRSISQALAKDMVETVERKDELGIVKVRIGAISTIITIEIVEMADGRFVTRQDHNIRIPGHGTYLIRESPYGFPGEALHDVLKEYKFWFKQAVQEGHAPGPSWWVPIER
jgi:hypothetical protein